MSDNFPTSNDVLVLEADHCLDLGVAHRLFPAGKLSLKCL